MYPVFCPGCGLCLPLLSGAALGACATQAYLNNVQKPQPVILATPTQATLPYTSVLLIGDLQQLKSGPTKVYYRVRVPSNLKPNDDTFVFKVGNQLFKVKRPTNALPGDEIIVMVPESSFSHVQVATVPQHNAGIQAVVFSDHTIDENEHIYKQHNILSVKEGEAVEIITGTIENGLPPPYSDYCRIRLNNGKVGLVSRFVLQYASPKSSGVSVPPKAVRPT